MMKTQSFCSDCTYKERSPLIFFNEQYGDISYRSSFFSRNNNASNRKQGSAERSEVAFAPISTVTSIRSSHSIAHSTDKSNLNAKHSFISSDHDNQVNRENIRFVYLDVHSQLLPPMITSLRSINDYVQIFNDSSICYDFLQTSTDRIFFICPTDDKDLIKAVHDLSTVEAIFILNSDINIDRSQLTKVDGIYSHFEELLLGLRETLAWFEQTELDVFAFERDRAILWSQLWKAELMKPTDSKLISNKEQLVSMANEYYRDDPKLLQSINEFNHSYRRNDVLQWCFSSPFPSRLLHQALRTSHTEHLDRCRFLFIDISYILHRSNQRQISRELYRGMKLTDELLDRLMNHTGKLICPKGYFTWIKSKTTALKFACSSEHRTDLKPVLLKMTCEPSIPIGELSVKNAPTQIVLDLYTVFRVTYVNRGPVSSVRIEPADEDGRSIARGYRTKHKSESVQNLLDQLLILSKPSALVRRSLSSVKRSMAQNKISESVPSEGETTVREFLKCNEIDLALAYYQDMKPRTVQVLHAIAYYYAEKKCDYESAINYYKEAIELQEKRGEDPAVTLTQLATIYGNRQQFDLALSYHTRAYELLKKNPNVNQSLIANSLLGLANSYWGQQNLSEALNYAQQALIINELITSDNDLNLAINLAVIANTYHRLEKTTEALTAATRALTLLERSVPSDSPYLASLLNNIGAIQMVAGAFSDARNSLDQSLKIYEKILPDGHPTRMGIENSIRQITQLKQNLAEKSTAKSSDDFLPVTE